MRDPVLHTHVEDCLPDGHPLAGTTIGCVVCSMMVHAVNNECMATWVETGMGAYCIECFVKAIAEDGYAVVDDAFGLH